MLLSGAEVARCFEGLRSACSTGMVDDIETSTGLAAPRKYVWPWFVALAVVLAIILAVLWISKEVERTRRLREVNPPTPPAQASQHR